MNNTCQNVKHVQSKKLFGSWLIIPERQQDDIQQMKNYIHELYPKWNLEDKSDGQIVAIYFRIKERRTKK